MTLDSVNTGLCSFEVNVNQFWFEWVTLHCLNFHCNFFTFNH
nr:MAG TPA: hypothetical protein [Caudoviricetes sp.]